jgi:hypothetical protein
MCLRFYFCCFAGLAIFGKHFLLITVMVDPESSKTFNSLFDLTADIVSITIIVIGVRLL